jgi:hypothetical protein
MEENKELIRQQELIRNANEIEKARVAKEIAEMKAHMERNQALIDALISRNEKLESEVSDIHAHSKLIEEMKPWEIECRKLNKTNLNSPYGKKCMCDALNSYLAENNEENKR